MTKFCRWQNIGKWEVAAQDKSSMAAVHGGFFQFYAYVKQLLGFTPCALNGLPHHGIQEQSH